MEIWSVGLVKHEALPDSFSQELAGHKFGFRDANAPLYPHSITPIVPPRPTPKELKAQKKISRKDAELVERCLACEADRGRHP